jgi:hypothetical protein
VLKQANTKDMKGYMKTFTINMTTENNIINTTQYMESEKWEIFQVVDIQLKFIEEFIFDPSTKTYSIYILFLEELYFVK